MPAACSTSAQYRLRRHLRHHHPQRRHVNLGTGPVTATYNITNLHGHRTSTIDFGFRAVTLNGGTFNIPSAPLRGQWVNAVDYFFAQTGPAPR